MDREVTIFTDGANGQKHARWGFVAYEDEKRIFMHMGSFKGDYEEITNNIVEYNGLLYALNWVAMMSGHWDEADTGARTITICMDSKLVVNQVLGKYQTTHLNLRALHAVATDAMLQLKQAGYDINLEWIPREKNLADRYIKGKDVPTCLTSKDS